MRIRLSLPLVCICLIAVAFWGCKKKQAPPLVSMKTSLPAPKVKPEDVQFVKKPVAPGTKYRDAGLLKLNITLSQPNKKKIRVGTVEEKDRDEEVLAVQEGTVTKLRVTYRTVRVVEKRDNKTLEKPSPLKGKTFVLESIDDSLKITDAAGKPVSKEIAVEVQKNHANFGKPDRILQKFPAGSLRPGQRVPGLEEAMKLEVDDANDAGLGPRLRLPKARVTYKGTLTYKGCKCAVFAVSLTLKMSEGQVTVVFHSHGYQYRRLSDGATMYEELVGSVDMMDQVKVGRMYALEIFTYQ